MSKPGRKQSVYFPLEMSQEIKDEAVRIDRPPSWLVQYAWEIARPHIKQIRAHGAPP